MGEKWRRVDDEEDDDEVHLSKGGGLTATTVAATVGGGAPQGSPILAGGGVGAPLGGSSSPTPTEPWIGEGMGGSPPFLCLDGRRIMERVALWPAAGGPPA
ncbi:hypothetical protein Sjap_020123 [Stephania japonica]|uniref:Uncharacterized protein n=1 Tax=Stephania japonica TaxID=461633 RepID=A0AAP0I0F4_9MAGN